MIPSLPLALASLAVASTSLAHPKRYGCGGHELLMPRQAPQVTDLASSEISKVPEEQCQYYNYQPAIDIRPNYPTIWETATILPSDTAARGIFEGIQATLKEKVPNVQIKPATGAAGANYDRADPDCWWSWQGCTSPDPSLGIHPDVTTIPEPLSLGLTIDDGPNCSQNAFYDYLRETKQKASMFFIGSNIMGWPLQAIRAFADGHEICVHTWSHQPLTAMSDEQVFAELYYTRQIIKDLMGVTTKCWRPPQGDVDNRVRLIAQGLNMTNYIWNEETDDWRAQAPGSPVTTADVDNNYKAIVDKAKGANYTTGGGIILTHQSTNYTMETLMKWLPQLRSSFAHVVPLASAFNQTHPYVESNITYPDFAAYVAGEVDSKTTTGAPVYPSTTGVPNPSGTSASGGSAGAGASASASASAGARPSGAAGVGAVLPGLWAGVAAGALGLVLGL